MIYVIEYINYLLSLEMRTRQKFNLLLDLIRNNIKLVIKRKILNLKKYSKLQLVDNVSMLNCLYEVIYYLTNRTNMIKEPYLLNYQKDLVALNGKVPDINIYLLKDVKVLSESTSIIKNNLIYNYNLSKMSIFHDFKNPINQVLNSFETKTVSLYFKKHVVIREEYCIHLFNEHSHNYYHFMLEILPKFILISKEVNKNEKLKNIKFVLLIDENIPKQFLEALEFFSNINYEIRFISRHTIVTCEKLIFCSDLWLSLDNTKFVSEISNDFFVDRYAVELIKNNCKLIKVKPFRKVYFQRKNTQARYLSNTDELEKLLSDMGFEFVLPEKLSFYEQIKLMNECKVVVGVSGAAFFNILFMQDNTNAIIFSPNTISANYYIFQPLADVANVRLTHILTKNNFYDKVHANASIDIDEVSSFLKSLEII